MSLTLATTLMLGGAAIGGISALLGQKKDSEKATRDLQDYEKYYGLLEKRRIAAQSIQTGNIRLGALGANAENKAAAIEQFQTDAAQRNAAGNSGLSAGTPFYKLDNDIMERQMQVNDINAANRTKMGQNYNQALSTYIQGSMEDISARNNLTELADTAQYEGSFLAYALTGAGGAFAGAQTANSLMAMGVDSGLLTEDFLASDVFAARAKPYAGVESYTSDMFAKPYAGVESYTMNDSFYTRANPVPALGAGFNTPVLTPTFAQSFIPGSYSANYTMTNPGGLFGLYGGMNAKGPNLTTSGLVL